MTDETNSAHIVAIECMIAGLLPLLIDASPRRAEAIALLRTWGQRETAAGDEVALGNLAENVLKHLSSID